MRSWPAPEVPGLAEHGQGLPEPQLNVYDSAAGALRPVTPGRVARMYVCGITPYDATHLGHAATYLAFDLVNRVWRDAGSRGATTCRTPPTSTTRCWNAPRDTGDDWRDLAEREIELFRDDMTALRSSPPREYAGAVESIPLIIEFIERLRARGAAYDLDGDLYFPVSRRPGVRRGERPDAPRRCCRCSPSAAATPTARARRTPSTRCCGRPQRPGEPSWDSPFGRGRPGWHVECAAISVRNLGMAFDIEGGGCDLVFPHHEMSASHAEVATGERPHARAYVHAGMVGPRRREDVEVARQPRLRLAAAGRTAPTRWRSGWRCSPTTTAPTGSGPPTT